MKVFLDIGAHVGETLRVVVDPQWGFDRIYAFEPAPACWPKLQAAATSAVHLCEFGLWNQDATLALHNAGAIGASVSEEKEPTGATVDCRFRDAGEWFIQNLDPADTIYAKVNIEGAEAELMQRLAETGTLGYIDHLLIHFDVRKVPGKAHLEASTRGLLDAAGVEYLSADEIQFGGVYRGTRNWLRWCHTTSRWRDLRFKWLTRQEYLLRSPFYPLKKAVGGPRSL